MVQNPFSSKGRTAKSPGITDGQSDPTMYSVVYFRGSNPQPPSWGERQTTPFQPEQSCHVKTIWTLLANLPGHILTSNPDHSWQPMGLFITFRITLVSYRLLSWDPAAVLSSSPAVPAVPGSRSAASAGPPGVDVLSTPASAAAATSSECTPCGTFSFLVSSFSAPGL